MMFGYNIYEGFKIAQYPLHMGEDSMPRLNEILNKDYESSNTMTIKIDWSKYD